MSFKTLRQIAPYKSLTRCGMEELAQNARDIDPTGGMLFARGKNREQKDIARERILELFTLEAWPDHLGMLTMPGVDWRFERKLLGMREPGWMNKREYPSKTGITCIENDRSIYHGAIAEMPGLQTFKALTKVKTPPPFAERALKTKFIKRFYFANVDELMNETVTENWRAQFDAVWLDYTGPMSVDRLRIIERFYAQSIRRVLIITVLKARWNKDSSRAIERAGGHSEWLRKHIPGEILHEIEYSDTTPMMQIAIRKPN